MIALLGSTGMIGSDFRGRFLRPSRMVCDAYVEKSVDSYLRDNHIDLLINCVGFCGHRDTSGTKIHEDNVFATRNIAVACRNNGTRLIHFTTSIAGEGSTYTRCKQYSEDIIRDYCEDYSLVRIPWMIGLNKDKGFLPIILDHIDNDKELTIYQEQGSVSYTRDVAKYIMEHLYDLGKEEVVANSGVVSRQEWAEETARILGRGLKIKISEGMKKTKQFSGLDGKLRPWQEALRACLCDKGYSLQNLNYSGTAKEF